MVAASYLPSAAGSMRRWPTGMWPSSSSDPDALAAATEGGVRDAVAGQANELAGAQEFPDAAVRGKGGAYGDGDPLARRDRVGGGGDGADR